jgi:hypothetical protein
MSDRRWADTTDEEDEEDEVAEANTQTVEDQVPVASISQVRTFFFLFPSLMVTDQ